MNRPLSDSRSSPLPHPSLHSADIIKSKSYITACGVRTVWSKLFVGIESQPGAQVKKLNEMLTGLGMDGRPTMEKAKTIKEKRELERELGWCLELLSRVGI
jgi:hypothetical protein